MASEDWSRFLPQFKKQNVNRRKKLSEKQKAASKRKAKEYTPFPPEQLPRKNDIAMATGEYFLSDKQKNHKENEKKRDEKENRKTEKINERNKNLEAPAEDRKGSKAALASAVASRTDNKYENKKPSDVEALKKKFLKK